MTFSDIQAKIIKQVEYYFGDFNLMRDKFLKAQTAKDDGWVPLTVLLTFNRLKALTKEPSKVIEALKLSKSGLLEINEDETKVRRSPEMPLPEETEEYKNEMNKKTAHIKGFPADALFDDLWDYCAKLGDLNSLKLRKNKDKTFKGCVWAVYKTVEEADKAIKGALTYNNKELLRETREQQLIRKKEYFNKKNNLSKKNKSNQESSLKKSSSCEDAPSAKRLKTETNETNEANEKADVLAN
jgi:lupus La protein homolog